MRHFFCRLIDISLAGLTCAFALSFLARHDPLAEMFTPFMLQYALIGALLVALLLWQKASLWKILLALLVACAAMIGPASYLLAPAPVVVPAASSVSEEVMLLQYNVLYKDKNPENTIAWLREISASENAPDVLSLQEVNGGFVKLLKSLEKTYPYHFYAPTGGSHGNAILSRFPIRDYKRNRFKVSDNLVTTFKVVTPKHAIPIRFIEAHANSPRSPVEAVWRNEELQEIAEMMHGFRLEKNRIVIGDINMTPYSPWFGDFLAGSGLRHAMQGFGVISTWPSVLPAPLRIPIDHVFISPEMEALSYATGPAQGSDHLPLLVRVRAYK